MSSPISKSAFIKSEQCLKHFYLYKNHAYLRDNLSKEKQLIFKRGNDVGVFSQQLFPNGIDVTIGEKRDQQLFAQKTKDLIEKGETTIYEATFIYDGLLVMVDILNKQDDNWIAYEVKSSLKITETYVKDACFQYYVIKNCLPNLIDFNLLTLNPKYVLGAELDIQSLFKKTSIIKDAIKNTDYFSHKTQEAKFILEQGKIPDIKIGTHCFQPYTCDFLGSCWKNTSVENSIFTLGKLSKPTLFELYNQNIKTIEELPAVNENEFLNKKEIQIQIESVKKQLEQINIPEIKSFISNIKEPICSLDIEVWMPALPFYEGTKPFQQIPFLFSMVNKNNNTYEKYSYFKPIENDNRLEFLETILEKTKPFNTILMYDKSLEESVLNQLAELYPTYRTDINTFKQKIVDIAEPIQKANYYHPKMQGNFTLKSIAPILNSEFDFSALTIQSGITAMYIYESLLLETNVFESQQIKEQLIEYCELDALVTLEFFSYLKTKV
jgi:predicted RecB family nuclease